MKVSISSNCKRIGFAVIALCVSFAWGQQASSAPAASATSQTTMPMPIRAALFIQSDRFSSAVTVVNDALAATQFTLLLQDEAGVEISKSEFSLNGHSQKVIEIGALLRGPQRDQGTVIGSVEVQPAHSGVAAQLSITYTQGKQQLHTEEEFAMPNPAATAIYRGVSTKAVGSPFIALKNTSKRSLQVALQCIPEAGGPTSRDLRLGPQQLLFVAACLDDGGISSFVRLGKQLDNSDQDPGAVGVSVSSDANEDELGVFGIAWSKFKVSKLSSIFFVTPDDLHSSETAYVGFAQGPTKPLLGGTYSALLAISNFSDTAASVLLKTSHTSEAGSPQLESSSVTIPPRSSKTVQLAAAEADSALRNSIVLQSSLPPGLLMTKLTSVPEQEKLPILEYQPKDTQQKENSGLHPWSIQQGLESTVLLFNYTPEEQYFNVRVYANNATWRKALLLRSMETRNLDIRHLIDAQIADEKGKTLPKNAISGEVQWSTPGRYKGVGRMLVSSPGIGLARNFSCGECVEICGVTLSPAA